VLGWDHGGVGELLRELQPSGAVPAFAPQALAARAAALLQQPPAPPAVIPYTLSAMQDATLAVYDEFDRR
ncbi:MAG: glycosyl transferase, partial [Gammaproteobacteria bacterium]|nr:glycosyl transferase [Gammaproteobacteria bacterium]